jgi:hypothetical protein
MTTPQLVEQWSSFRNGSVLHFSPVLQRRASLSQQFMTTPQLAGTLI